MLMVCWNWPKLLYLRYSLLFLQKSQSQRWRHPAQSEGPSASQIWTIMDECLISSAWIMAKISSQVRPSWRHFRGIAATQKEGTLKRVYVHLRWKGELVASWGKTEPDSKEGIQKVCILKGKRERGGPKFFFWRKSYILLVLCSSFAYSIKILAEKGGKTSRRYIRVSIFPCGLLCIMESKSVCMYMYMYKCKCKLFIPMGESRPASRLLPPLQC